MAPPVQLHMCTGSTRGCFFSQRVYAWETYKYACKRCHVRAPHLCGSPALKELCIKCFYEHPSCPYAECKHKGCKEELLARNTKFEAGDVELSSSAEGPPMAFTGAASSTMAAAAAGPPVPSTQGALSSLQMIQALKDEVVELREMIRVMQDRTHRLEQERVNQAWSWTGEWTGECNDWSGR